jgi:hypothetical protein
MNGTHLKKIESRLDLARTVLFPEEAPDHGRGVDTTDPDMRLAKIIQRLTRQGRTAKAIAEDVTRVHRLLDDVIDLCREVRWLQSSDRRTEAERRRDARAAAGDYWWMEN